VWRESECFVDRAYSTVAANLRTSSLNRSIRPKFATSFGSSYERGNCRRALSSTTRTGSLAENCRGYASSRYDSNAADQLAGFARTASAMKEVESFSAERWTGSLVDGLSHRSLMWE